jgi:glutamate synthase domain-containing protein 1
MPRSLPAAQGLYRPDFEHDACGVSFIVDMKGRKSHDIVLRGIGALCNLEHRGASGAEKNTGDGAGVLLQMPDRFFRAVVGFDLPDVGSYAAGMGVLNLGGRIAATQQGRHLLDAPETAGLRRQATRENTEHNKAAALAAAQKRSR